MTSNEKSKTVLNVFDSMAQEYIDYIREKLADDEKEISGRRYIVLATNKK